MPEGPQPPDYEVEAALQEVRRLHAEHSAPDPNPDPAMATQTEVHRTLYRIVRGATPARGDFTSNLTRCLPMRGAESKEPLLWAGLSMFDTPDAAQRNAHRFEGRIGTYLAALTLPLDDARVLVRQTLRPGHFTVLCCEDTCISLITDVQPIVGLSA